MLGVEPGATRSVDDVERVAESLVELGARRKIEMAHRFRAEVDFWRADDGRMVEAAESIGWTVHTPG